MRKKKTKALDEVSVIVTAKTKKSDGGPDWDSSHSTSGPGIWDIPKPWVYRYPNDKGVRRQVTIRLETWRGMSLGATHFYARVELEENEIWNPKELGWHRSDAVPECKRTFYRAHVFTRAEGIKFIEVVINTFFSDATQYRLEYMYSESDKWADIKKALTRD